MVERFVEEKVCITACLKEKIFQKHFSVYKISKSIEWDYLEEFVGTIRWISKNISILFLAHY